MAKNNEVVLREYAEVSASIKELEGKQDGLKVKIVADFKKQGIHNLHSDFGTFSIAERPTYRFSKSVQNLEEELKSAKQREIDSGKAKVERTSEYLSYRVK